MRGWGGAGLRRASRVTVTGHPGNHSCHFRVADTAIACIGVALMAAMALQEQASGTATPSKTNSRSCRVPEAVFERATLPPVKSSFRVGIHAAVAFLAGGRRLDAHSCELPKAQGRAPRRVRGTKRIREKGPIAGEPRQEVTRGETCVRRAAADPGSDW